MNLKVLDWSDPAISIRGALDLRAGPRGLAPRRLPDWAIRRSPDPPLSHMAGLTSGVRLVLQTDAQVLELDVEETGFEIAGEGRRPAVFDLIIDGALVVRSKVHDGPTLVFDAGAQPSVSRRTGRASLIRFEDLPGRDKRIEIWLPHSAATRLLALRCNAGARLRVPTPTGLTWAHYGSSISHGMDAAGPSATWPATAARDLGWELTSLGFAGQCLLDGVVARALRDLDVDRISLKLGINVVNHDAMRERAFVSAAGAFLDTIRDTRPDVPILVISPVLCPMAETRPGPTLREDGVIRTVDRPDRLAPGALTLQRARQILADLVAQRREDGDHNLSYLDGLELLGPSDAASLHDGLHPDSDAHDVMGRRFAALADRWT